MVPHRPTRAERQTERSTPVTDTVQQLHELPDLAAEVYLTWGHPNPYRQTEGNRA